MKDNYLVVFNSRNHAFLVESILKKMGYKVELIQAPKYLSKHCNMAVLINGDGLNYIKSRIDTNSIDIYRIYRYYYKGQKMVYEII